MPDIQAALGHGANAPAAENRAATGAELGGAELGGAELGGAEAKAAAASGGSAYDALVHLAVMPALRGALANEWAVRSSDAAIELLTTWRSLLPDALWKPLFSGQILPRLASELSAWQVRSPP